MTIPTATNAGGFPLLAPESQALPPPHPPEPSFSVLIAAYNAGRTVASAVGSVLAQTHAPLEVIVCDDGSSDRTLAELEQLGSTIRIVRGEHRGVSAARNACLALARGTHVVPFDSDDLMEPRCLEAYDAALRVRPDLGIVTCDAYLESEGAVFDRYYRRVARFAIVDQRRAALHQHFIFGFPAIERAAIETCGGWDEQMAGGVDTDLWLRLILNGVSAGLVWEPLAVYRLRANSVSDDRAAGLRRMVTIVERASHHPSLTPAERDFAQAEIAAKERGARSAELDAALQTGSQEIRARAAAILNARNLPFGRRERLSALAAVVSPRIAGRLHVFRARRRGTTSLRQRTRNF